MIQVSDLNPHFHHITLTLEIQCFWRLWQENENLIYHSQAKGWESKKDWILQGRPGAIRRGASCCCWWLRCSITTKTCVHLIDQSNNPMHQQSTNLPTTKKKTINSHRIPISNIHPSNQSITAFSQTTQFLEFQQFPKEVNPTPITQCQQTQQNFLNPFFNPGMSQKPTTRNLPKFAPRLQKFQGRLLVPIPNVYYPPNCVIMSLTSHTSGQYSQIVSKMWSLWVRISMNF